MIEDFKSLAAALVPYGITAQVGDPPFQLIISRQMRAVWPERGNSFWITRQGESWYLITWLPSSCRLPPDGNIVALCIECMAIGSKAMYTVPDELIAKHRLEEVDEDVMERLLRDTD